VNFLNNGTFNHELCVCVYMNVYLLLPLEGPNG